MTTRTSVATVAALTALGAALRLPGLDSGLWFDEIVTLVESVRPTLREIVTAFPGNNNHPLYSLLAHLSVVACGEHNWTVRLPAFVFGVAGIPLLYWVAVAVTNRTEALLASLLLAVSYHGVWFSQNARGYTILLFLTLLATWLLLRLLERPSQRLAIAYGVGVGLGVYTHLTMTFVAAAHGIVWGRQVSREPTSFGRSQHVRTALLAFGVAALLGGLLYLPTAAQVYGVFTGPRPAAAAVATPRWAALEILRGLRVGFGTLGLLAALALLMLGAVSYLRRTPVAALLFLLPGVVTAVGIVVMRAPIRPRFFLLLLGFGLLMLVRGAMEFGRFLFRRDGDPRAELTGIVLVTAIAIVSTVSLRENYTYPKQDYDGALRFIERHRAASEPVVTSGLAVYPYSRYYGKPWPAVQKPEELDRLRTGAGRTWVVYSFEEYMDPAVVERLHRSCGNQQVFHGTLGGGDVVVCTLADRSQ